MHESSGLASRPAQRRLRLLLMGVFLALLAGEFYNCVFCCDHDFLWHRDFGITFIENEMYVSTEHQHYLPARAMLDAATAWMPYRLDRAIWFLATCAGLAYCTRFWSHLGGNATAKWLAPASMALIVCGTYIHRDLAECGLQLFLLCLLTAALAAIVRGRAAWCGFWLGLAAVYKVMPLVFLPYLLWKRQWKAAGWMVASGCFFSLLPALYLGWQTNLRLHEQWLAKTVERLAIEDPSDNGIEPPVLWNRSLPLALARLVQEYPPDHPLHVDGAQSMRMATLEPLAARRFVHLTLAGLVVVLAWRFRRTVSLDDGGAALAGEWAMVCILVALLSPLCWLHHLVLAIPATLLFAQTAAAGRASRWPCLAAAVATALILLVHRDMLGGSVWNVVSVIHPHTVACLLAGAVALSPGAPSTWRTRRALQTATILARPHGLLAPDGAPGRTSTPRLPVAAALR